MKLKTAITELCLSPNGFGLWKTAEAEKVIFPVFGVKTQ
jgi:hypothetical protein